MKKIYLLAICALQTLSLGAFGQDEVIDLGSLEVVGESRQPPIKFYQPSGPSEEIFQRVGEMNFEQFEALLTTPSSDALTTKGVTGK